MSRPTKFFEKGEKSSASPLKHFTKSLAHMPVPFEGVDFSLLEGQAKKTTQEELAQRKKLLHDFGVVDHTARGYYDPTIAMNKIKKYVDHANLPTKPTNTQVTQLVKTASYQTERRVEVPLDWAENPGNYPNVKKFINALWDYLSKLSEIFEKINQGQHTPKDLVEILKVAVPLSIAIKDAKEEMSKKSNAVNGVSVSFVEHIQAIIPGFFMGSFATRYYNDKEKTTDEEKRKNELGNEIDQIIQRVKNELKKKIEDELVRIDTDYQKTFTGLLSKNNQKDKYFHLQLNKKNQDQLVSEDGKKVELEESVKEVYEKNNTYEFVTDKVLEQNKEPAKTVLDYRNNKLSYLGDIRYINLSALNTLQKSINEPAARTDSLGAIVQRLNEVESFLSSVISRQDIVGDLRKEMKDCENIRKDWMQFEIRVSGRTKLLKSKNSDVEEISKKCDNGVKLLNESADKFESTAQMLKFSAGMRDFNQCGGNYTLLDLFMTEFKDKFDDLKTRMLNLMLNCASYQGRFLLQDEQTANARINGFKSALRAMERAIENLMNKAKEAKTPDSDPFLKEIKDLKDKLKQLIDIADKVNSEPDSAASDIRKLLDEDAKLSEDYANLVKMANDLNIQVTGNQAGKVPAISELGMNDKQDLNKRTERAEAALAPDGGYAALKKQLHQADGKYINIKQPGDELKKAKSAASYVIQDGIKNAHDTLKLLKQFQYENAINELRDKIKNEMSRLHTIGGIMNDDGVFIPFAQPVLNEQKDTQIIDDCAIIAGEINSKGNEEVSLKNKLNEIGQEFDSLKATFANHDFPQKKDLEGGLSQYLDANKDIVMTIYKEAEKIYAERVEKSEEVEKATEKLQNDYGLDNSAGRKAIILAREIEKNNKDDYSNVCDGNELRKNIDILHAALVHFPQERKKLKETKADYKKSDLFVIPPCVREEGLIDRLQDDYEKAYLIFVNAIKFAAEKAAQGLVGAPDKAKIREGQLKHDEINKISLILPNGFIKASGQVQDAMVATQKLKEAIEKAQRDLDERDNLGDALKDFGESADALEAAGNAERALINALQEIIKPSFISMDKVASAGGLTKAGTDYSPVGNLAGLDEKQLKELTECHRKASDLHDDQKNNNLFSQLSEIVKRSGLNNATSIAAPVVAQLARNKKTLQTLSALITDAEDAAARRKAEKARKQQDEEKRKKELDENLKQLVASLEKIKSDSNGSMKKLTDLGALTLSNGQYEKNDLGKLSESELNEIMKSCDAVLKLHTPGQDDSYDDAISVEILNSKHPDTIEIAHPFQRDISDKFDVLTVLKQQAEQIQKQRDDLIKKTKDIEDAANKIIPDENDLGNSQLINLGEQLTTLYPKIPDQNAQKSLYLAHAKANDALSRAGERIAAEIARRADEKQKIKEQEAQAELAKNIREIQDAVSALRDELYKNYALLKATEALTDDKLTATDLLSDNHGQSVKSPDELNKTHDPDELDNIQRFSGSLLADSKNLDVKINDIRNTIDRVIGDRKIDAKLITDELEKLRILKDNTDQLAKESDKNANAALKEHEKLSKIIDNIHNGDKVCMDSVPVKNALIPQASALAIDNEKATKAKLESLNSAIEILHPNYEQLSAFDKYKIPSLLTKLDLAKEYNKDSLDQIYDAQAVILGSLLTKITKVEESLKQPTEDNIKPALESLKLIVQVKNPIIEITQQKDNPHVRMASDVLDKIMDLSSAIDDANKHLNQEKSREKERENADFNRRLNDLVAKAEAAIRPLTEPDYLSKNIISKEYKVNIDRVAPNTLGKAEALTEQAATHLGEDNTQGLQAQINELLRKYAPDHSKTDSAILVRDDIVKKLSGVKELCHEIIAKRAELIKIAKTIETEAGDLFKPTRNQDADKRILGTLQITMSRHFNDPIDDSTDKNKPLHDAYILAAQALKDAVTRDSDLNKRNYYQPGPSTIRPPVLPAQPSGPTAEDNALALKKIYEETMAAHQSLAYEGGVQHRDKLRNEQKIKPLDFSLEKAITEKALEKLSDAALGNEDGTGFGIFPVAHGLISTFDAPYLALERRRQALNNKQHNKLIVDERNVDPGSLQELINKCDNIAKDAALRAKSEIVKRKQLRNLTADAVKRSNELLTDGNNDKLIKTLVPDQMARKDVLKLLAQDPESLPEKIQTIQTILESCKLAEKNLNEKVKDDALSRPVSMACQDYVKANFNNDQNIRKLQDALKNLKDAQKLAQETAERLQSEKEKAQNALKVSIIKDYEALKIKSDTLQKETVVFFGGNAVLTNDGTLNEEKFEEKCKAKESQIDDFLKNIILPALNVNLKHPDKNHPALLSALDDLNKKYDALNVNFLFDNGSTYSDLKQNCKDELNKRKSNAEKALQIASNVKAEIEQKKDAEKNPAAQQVPTQVVAQPIELYSDLIDAYNGLKDKAFSLQDFIGTGAYLESTVDEIKKLDEGAFEEFCIKNDLNSLEQLVKALKNATAITSNPLSDNDFPGLNAQFRQIDTKLPGTGFTEGHPLINARNKCKDVLSTTANNAKTALDIAQGVLLSKQNKLERERIPSPSIPSKPTHVEPAVALNLPEEPEADYHLMNWVDLTHYFDQYVNYIKELESKKDTIKLSSKYEKYVRPNERFDDLKAEVRKRMIEHYKTPVDAMIVTNNTISNLFPHLKLPLAHDSSELFSDENVPELGDLFNPYININSITKNKSLINCILKLQAMLVETFPQLALTSLSEYEAKKQFIAQLEENIAFLSHHLTISLIRDAAVTLQYQDSNTSQEFFVKDYYPHPFGIDLDPGVFINHEKEINSRSNELLNCLPTLGLLQQQLDAEKILFENKLDPNALNNLEKIKPKEIDLLKQDLNAKLQRLKAIQLKNPLNYDFPEIRPRIEKAILEIQKQLEAIEAEKAKRKKDSDIKTAQAIRIAEMAKDPTGKGVKQIARHNIDAWVYIYTELSPDDRKKAVNSILEQEPGIVLIDHPGGMKFTMLLKEPLAQSTLDRNHIDSINPWIKNHLETELVNYLEEKSNGPNAKFDKDYLTNADAWFASKGSKPDEKSSDRYMRLYANLQKGEIQPKSDAALGIADRLKYLLGIRKRTTDVKETYMIAQVAEGGWKSKDMPPHLRGKITAQRNTFIENYVKKAKDPTKQRAASTGSMLSPFLVVEKQNDLINKVDETKIYLPEDNDTELEDNQSLVLLWQRMPPFVIQRADDIWVLITAKVKGEDVGFYQRELTGAKDSTSALTQATAGLRTYSKEDKGIDMGATDKAGARISSQVTNYIENQIINNELNRVSMRETTNLDPTVKPKARP